MIRYRNAAGRVVTRSQPDRGLEASKRWHRVEPLSPTPLPVRAPENDKSDADASEKE